MSISIQVLVLHRFENGKEVGVPVNNVLRFYPKEDKPGTVILAKWNGSLHVKESFEEVLKQMKEGGSEHVAFKTPAFGETEKVMS